MVEHSPKIFASEEKATSWGEKKSLDLKVYKKKTPKKNYFCR